MIAILKGARRNPAIQWGVRLGFAAAILALLATQIDFTTALQGLTSLDFRVAALALGIYYAERGIMAYQRSLGLKPLGLDFTIVQMFKIVLASSFYSLLLPGDLSGSGAAWYKLSRPAGKGLEAGALIVYFRLVDTLVLMAIGLIGIAFDPFFSSPGFRLLIAAMFGSLALLSTPFFSPKAAARIEGIIRRLGQRLPAPAVMHRIGATIWRSLAALQSLSRGTIVWIIALSATGHVLGILSYYFLARGVGIDQPLHIIGWIRSIVLVLQMMPISIAGLGVREASLVLLLENYGVPRPLSLSLSFAVFGVTVIGGLSGGLLELWAWSRRRVQHDGLPQDGTTGPGA